MKNGNGNFITRHYDWLLAGVAALALAAAVVFFVQVLGEDGDSLAADEVRRLESRKPDASGVEPADMTVYELITRTSKAPVRLGDVDPRGYSFLASDRRVFCGLPECHAPIPPDAKVCPVCNGAQPEEPQPEVVLDADGDGLNDEWERKFGLNPADPADADADLDGDAFTNREEYEAGTDPSDRNSHPDYLDSLRLKLPLKQTVLPFYLRSYMKTPSGMKLEFFSPKERNDYGTLGRAHSVFVGTDIGETGFTVKSFDQKERTVKIKGGAGATRKVDESFATLERKSDGKTVKVVVSGEKPRKVPVDVQAVLVYERGGTKEYVVVPGDKIDLSGAGYVVKEITPSGKGASVVIEDAAGKTRTLEALEQ
jgi:hypothetical protein